MKKITTGVVASLIGISGFLSAAAPSLASAATLTWGHTTNTVNGGSMKVDGRCVSGSGCERTKTFTSAQSNTWTRYGTAAGSGSGSINRSVAFTNPNGISATF